MLRVYNTLTRQKEEFRPLADNQVKMYVCGPTVYGLLHIGNGRTFMTWDMARRYLEFRGYAVTYVQNFTDVDDKIIQRANDEGISAEEVASKYTLAYFEDMDGLGVRRATYYPKATEYIPQMVAHIQGLIEKGLAYATDGDVYFRVSGFPDYGKLSGRTGDDDKNQSRVGEDARKEDAKDFALWKAAKPGEPAWESPWGLGRPGWHIECSAMVRGELGDTIDIHAGGMDLKFPHHENEIAQSEGLTGHPFVRYWMHTGFLNMDAEKMSKSLGNVRTAREMLALYGQQALRAFMLNTHYSQELDFSDAAIKGAQAGLARLRQTLSRVEEAGLGAPEGTAQPSTEEVENTFVQAMDDDFNTAAAIGHFHRLAKAMATEQKEAKDKGEPGPNFSAQVQAMRRQADVLGLDLSAPVAEAEEALGNALTEQLLEVLITLRREAKEQKNWAMADSVRDHLKGLGIALVDHKDGTTRWELAPKVPV